MKGRISQNIGLTLNKKTVDELKKYAKAQNRSIVSIVEEGIKLIVSDERNETAIEGTFRSVSRIEGRVKGLRADLESMTDLLCFYTYHWFCHTPSIPKTIKGEAITSGKARYSKFIDLLKERRRSGESFAVFYLESDKTDEL